MISISSNAQNAFVHDWSIGYYGFNVDAPQAICTDANSNIYSVGYFEDSIDMDTVSADRELWSQGLRDGYINKLDSSGNPIWSLAIGGPSLDECLEIAYDGNSNLYVSGTFTGTVDFNPGSGVYNMTSAGQYDGFLLKLDTNGVFIWALSWGSWASEQGGQILVDVSSDIYMLCNFGNTLDLDPGSGTQMTTSSGAGTFIVKLTSSGSFVWGGDFTVASEPCFALDGNGFIYIAGTCQGVNCDMDPGSGIINFSTANNTEDIFIIKMSVAGSYAWHKTIGNTSVDRAYSVGVDVNGNVFVSGLFRGNVDFDPGAGSVMMNAGFTIDSYLCRLDPSGNFLNAVSFASSASDMQRCYTIQDSDGYFYLMGTFADAVDFDPGTATYTLTSLGGSLDIYYACLDSACNFLWATAMDGTGNQTTGEFCFDYEGNIVSTHPLSGDIDTDMGSGTDMVNEYNNTDIFVDRMRRVTPLSSGVPQYKLECPSVFPNPCSDFFNLKLDAVVDIQTIQMFDINGKEAEIRWSATRAGAVIDVNGLAPGVYIIKVETAVEQFKEIVVLSQN